MSEPAHDPVQPEESEVRHLPVPAQVSAARPIERPPTGGLQAFLTSLPTPTMAAADGFLMSVVT